MPNFVSGKPIDMLLGDFAPDYPSAMEGKLLNLLDMQGAIPTIAGSRARNAPLPYAPALPETPLGGYVALYASGALSVLAGGPNYLWRLVANAWTPIGGPYGVTQPWNFTQFNDDVIAFNGSLTAPQVAAGSGGMFGNLGGSPPANMFTGISVGGVLVGYVGPGWANSAAGTDNNWTPNVQTQAGTGTLYDYPGNVVAAASFFRMQIVFKPASMYILSYIGQDTIWQNQLASNATGTWGQGCVCVGPEAVYFIGNDDFWMTQGYAPTRLQGLNGPNGVKQWFFRNVYRDQNNNPIYLANTCSWYDPENAVVNWYWVSNQAPFAGVPDRVLSYNTRSNRWAADYLNTKYVIPNTQPGLTSGLYFDTSNVLQSWRGTPTVMGLLTAYFGDSSNRTQLLKAKPQYLASESNQIGLPTSQALTPLSVDVLGQTDRAGDAGVLGVGGWFMCRDTNRYHRLHHVTTGPTEIMGWSYEGRLAGTR
jgi:hypothetical protein